MTTYIYALHCPIANTVRYIGKSNNPEERFKQHLYFAETRRYDHHTARWIRKVLSAGLLPRLEVFAEVCPPEDWREVERHWIAKGKSLGWKLTNTTAGGDGVEITCPIALAKWHKAVKEAWADPVLRRRTSENLLRFYATPEGKALKSEVSRRPEKKAASAAGQSKNWQDPEYREKIMAAKTAPEVIQKQSEKAANQWADPVVREKMIEGLKRGQQARRARNARTPEQEIVWREERLAKRRDKRAAQKAAKLAATTSAPYTESS